MTSCTLLRVEQRDMYWYVYVHDIEELHDMYIFT